MAVSTKQTGLSVSIVGRDGNAFAILGACGKVLERAGLNDVKDEFMAEAMSGDYDHLLQTVLAYFEVE